MKTYMKVSKGIRKAIIYTKNGKDMILLDDLIARFRLSFSKGKMYAIIENEVYSKELCDFYVKLLNYLKNDIEFECILMLDVEEVDINGRETSSMISIPCKIGCPDIDLLTINFNEVTSYNYYFEVTDDLDIEF